MIVLSNANLGKLLAKRLKARWRPVSFLRFPDGELKLNLPSLPAAEESVLALFSLTPNLSINDFFTALILTLTELRRQLPKNKITLVLPYLPYARQDKEKPGETNVCRAFLALLKTLVPEVWTVDPHAAWPKMRHWFAPNKFVILPSNELFLDFLKKIKTRNHFLVAPDRQAAERYKNLAHTLGWPLVFFAKKRLSGKKVKQTLVSALPAAKTAVFVDDIISTGGTLLEAQKILKSRGVKKFIALATHFVGKAPNLKNLRQAGFRIITTNSLEWELNGLKRLDILPIILSHFSSSKLS